MNRFAEFDPIFLFCMKHKENTLHIHINYYDNPFCPQVLIDEAEKCKRDDLKDYAHIWLGEPIDQASLAILSREKILSTYDREVNTDGQIEFGADIARFGKDRTVITKRKGLVLLEHWIFTKQDTVATANFIMEQASKEDLIKVDDTGVGGGVTDILSNNYYNVIPINFGGTAKDSDKYPNIISEMWFEFKEMIDDVKLYEIDGLLGELANRRWKMDKKGRRMVESKDDYKKRESDSPDLADSLLLCFYNYLGEISVSFF